MQTVLSDLTRQTGLQFQQSGNTILVKKTDSAQAASRTVRNITISGIVYDSSKEPAVGATVRVKDSSIGTSTGIDGRYTLANVPEDAEILISMIGCMPRQYKATDKGLQRIELSENSAVLDEVVVVGYGTQSSKLITTSISKVKLDEIDQANDYNPIKMLQGRVAGVNIANASGTPGETPNIRCAA